jgi:organic radical activating enzyme
VFGDNPIRKPVTGDGTALEVVSIFYTIQGEGHRAGQPAIFIRLGGCNLACKFCDTEFEKFEKMPIADILKQASKFSPQPKLIVITGGEPFRQPIELLCSELIKLGYIVQIETNGTLFRPIPAEVEIVCSPKTRDIRPDLHERITSFKFLISASNPDYNNVWLKTDKPIYVQPMDDYDPTKNAENLKLTTKIALENGYNISLQLHKIINVE